MSEKQGPEPRRLGSRGEPGEITDVKDNSVATDIKSCDELRFVAWVCTCKYCDGRFLDPWLYEDMCPACAKWKWDELYDGRGHQR